MKSAKKISGQPVETVTTGLFSKKEAGAMIASGQNHVLSLHPQQADILLKTTRKILETHRNLSYPWEMKGSSLITVSSSKGRYEAIYKIIEDTKITKKRGLREKVEGVLEELLTNSIYHAYRKPDGSEKYERKKLITLQANEQISIAYNHKSDGVYLSITDQGGSLSFAQISKAFGRCYGSITSAQIETKDSGAGLGVYLIFEAVTHLKIFCKKDSCTQISCWIGDNSESEKHHFSFNFFNEE